ncbi:MAG: DUF4340 domain-containing protein [Pseudomonadales bacterium]|nr:DUF4340 domain-containing protein [Pseudomonadales bacterium]NIX08023.1 DUF4340 domain-containing protein [Pseudomonadales bacterium]
MSSRIGWLAALLAIQLVVTGALLLVDARGAGSTSPGFLEVAADSVDRLVVSGEGTVLEFTRSGERWSLGSGVAADAEKIGEVVEKLAEIDPGWPVAATEASRDRFRVTGDDHERRVALFAGESQLAEIYLGTSPGFRRIHARRADADEVYSIDFAVYELPLSDSDWLDKDLLGADGEIAGITREEHWSVERGAEGWLLTSVPPMEDARPGASADQDAAERLVERVGDLRVTGFAPEGPAYQPAAAFNVTDESGSYGLRIFRDPDNDEYAVESDRHPGRFGLAAYVAEQLVLELDDLRPVEPNVEAVAPVSDTPASPGGG